MTTHEMTNEQYIDRFDSGARDLITEAMCEALARGETRVRSTHIIAAARRLQQAAGLSEDDRLRP